jgi:hypothetical protein
METMHYDDGFDLMAPPEPPMDLQNSQPAKLISDEEEHDMLWFTPLVFGLSTLVSASLIYWACKVVSAALK